MLVLLLAIVFSCACRETPFEQAHDKAVAENPAGVELHVVVVGGKRTFHVSEAVPVEEFYTAKYPGEWHLEILDGWNEAGVSDEAHLSDGTTARLFGMMGIICCDSQHVWLSLDPVRLPYPSPINTVEGYKSSSPRWIRFPKPGKYEFYVTTRRVFNRDQEMKTYQGLGYVVTSEDALSVRIVQ